MPALQTSAEVESLLARLEGQTIATLQVLGINSLKSTSTMPEALVGELIASTGLDDRLVTVVTAEHQVVFDLQRTGKLVWLARAAPYVTTPSAPRPTVRMVLANGQGLDFTEPAKTKRITVTISSQS